MHSEQPLTRDGWYTLVRSKQAVAVALQDDKRSCREAWFAAGMAFEYLLKAEIMRFERLNSWPSREARPELYTHSLTQLMDAAGLARTSIPANMRGAFKTALDWDRNHDYRVGTMPRRIARAMVEAVFGEGGIERWLISR